MSSFIVAMALMALNLSVVLFGIWRNDAACREAARAAAQQRNAADALAAARGAVTSFAVPPGIFSSPTVLSGAADFTFETFPDADGHIQFDQGPHVAVTTEITAHLPAPVIFNGVGFTDILRFKQRYTYPILTDAQANDNVEPGPEALAAEGLPPDEPAGTLADP